MVPTNQLIQLLTEAAPLLDLQALIAFDEAQVWTLAVDDDTLLQVEYDETSGQLQVAVELAPLPPGSGRELLETLLIYNDQQRRTGGICLALDGPGGTVIQSLSLAVTELDASRLTRTLANFIAVLRGWREILSGPDPAAASTDAKQAPEAPSGGLRV